MLTISLCGVINFGSACLRVSLGAINCANGIFLMSFRGNEVTVGIQRSEYGIFNKTTRIQKNTDLHTGPK